MFSFNVEICSELSSHFKNILKKDRNVILKALYHKKIAWYKLFFTISNQNAYYRSHKTDFCFAIQWLLATLWDQMSLYRVKRRYHFFPKKTACFCKRLSSGLEHVRLTTVVLSAGVRARAQAQSFICDSSVTPCRH